MIKDYFQGRLRTVPKAGIVRQIEKSYNLATM